MQSIQSANPKPGTMIFVTFKNHKWAAEILKVDEADLLKEVQTAGRKEELVLKKVPK